jgi:hypothetical protein
MNWSEVIMVRSAGSNAKVLAAFLQDLKDDVARSAGEGDIRVFRRENLETDICVVLFHSRKKAQIGGSPLGLRIVAAFKEIGLVHHTIWNEIE